MFVLNGFFKDNTIVLDRPMSVPDGTKAFVSFEDSPEGPGPRRVPQEYLEESPEEQAFRRRLDPQEQLKALKEFHKDLERIKNVLKRLVHRGGYLCRMRQERPPHRG
jgi:hypothetical protein